MLAQDLISNLIPSVQRSDSVFQVIERMKEFKVAHLPVLEGADYLGLVLEKEIQKVSDPSQIIGSEFDNLLLISVDDNQHVYEVIDLMARYELTLLPVLTPEKEFKGCVTLPLLVRNFSDLTAAGQPGAIFVLGLAMLDYSPAMLSKIIEDNNAKIISLYVVADPNGRELSVTIKVNTEETSSIMRSFDRYGYKVKSYFLANSQLEDFYRSRYEEFMKYLNI